MTCFCFSRLTFKTCAILKTQLCATLESKYANLLRKKSVTFSWSPCQNSQPTAIFFNPVFSQLFLFFTCQIFTRILRSLNLPVGTSQMVVPRYVTNAYDISHVVLWVSSLLVCLFLSFSQLCSWLRQNHYKNLTHSKPSFVNFREDLASKLKHNSAVSLIVLHLSSIRQTMVAGW